MFMIEENEEYQLVNFNMPTRVKKMFDLLVKSKRANRTAVINQLIEQYCRQELMQLKLDVIENADYARGISRFGDDYAMTDEENENSC